MAFKLNNPPYKLPETPIYHVNMEDDVLGKANRNGTIILNEKMVVYLRLLGESSTLIPIVLTE